MGWMIGSLFHDVFENVSQSKTLFVISLDLLFKFLGACVFYILSKNFKFFIAFDNFIFEFTNLFLKRHNQESFLLILLSSLSDRDQILI